MYITSLSLYIYIYVYVYIYIYIYIYIHKPSCAGSVSSGFSGAEGPWRRGRGVPAGANYYIHIYIYIYIYIHITVFITLYYIYYIYIYIYHIILQYSIQYCTPEIDTSEVIVEFQWHFPMDYQLHFPMEFHYSAVSPKDCHLSSKIFTGISQWIFSGVLQGNFSFAIPGVYTRSPLEDSRLFGPSPWKILATTYEQKRISEQPRPWRKSS